jgi:hypothetical protein
MLGKVQLKSRQLFSSALLSISAVCLLVPTTLAAIPSQKVEAPTSSASSFQIAAKLNGCPKATTVISYETKNYFAHICRGFDDQLFYRGIQKKNGSAINVSGTEYVNGSYFSQNGNILYLVDGTSLVVYRNNKVILREAVVRVYSD